MSATLTTYTRNPSSLYKTITADESPEPLASITLKHSAPPPRNLSISAANNRRVLITFVAPRNADHPEPNLRINSIPANTTELFADIFATYRETAQREKDILSFWRNDVRGKRRIWPDETPYEVFECGAKQPPGAAKQDADDWRIEVRGPRAYTES